MPLKSTRQKFATNVAIAPQLSRAANWQTWRRWKTPGAAAGQSGETGNEARKPRRSAHRNRQGPGARSSTCSTRRGFLSRRRPPRSARGSSAERSCNSTRPACEWARRTGGWVFHHDDSAFFVAAPSRAKIVVEDWDQTPAHDSRERGDSFHA